MAVFIDKIARLAHEVNRIYCLSHGDDSHLAWDQAPEWQRQSVRKGVIFLLTNKNATPADSHRSWLEEKTRDGWIYGPLKDPVLKTHPWFLPYEQLPEQERLKDDLFLAVVRGGAPS